MTPIMPKNTRSSTSSGFQLDRGLRARSLPSHQAAAKPIRYMIPYQWTLIGPSSTATGLNPGYCSMGKLYRFRLSLARDATEQGLEITGFRDGRMDGVIGRLAAK